MITDQTVFVKPCEAVDCDRWNSALDDTSTFRIDYDDNMTYISQTEVYPIDRMSWQPFEYHD